MLFNAIKKTFPVKFQFIFEFSSKLIASYLLWKVFTYFADYYEPQWWIDFYDFLALKTIQSSSFVFEHLFNFQIKYNQRNIFINQHNGIYVANHCLGLPAMVVFALSIIFYKGNWYHKLWYIPLGVLGVFIINVIRLLLLGYTQNIMSPYFWEFNHSYTYLVLAYGLILLLIIFWMEKFSE